MTGGRDVTSLKHLIRTLRRFRQRLCRHCDSIVLENRLERKEEIRDSNDEESINENALARRRDLFALNRR